jgi:transcriptional regulator with XRE-family HTH domain
MDTKELKKWRADHGLTQKQLAELLGLKVLAVARYETGVRKIPSFLHLALKELERVLDQKLPRGKGGKTDGSKDQRKKAGPMVDIR